MPEKQFNPFDPLGLFGLPGERQEVPNGGTRRPIGFFILIKGVIKGFDTEFDIHLLNKENVSPELWSRMGEKPFYEVQMYEGYTGRKASGYISKERLEEHIQSPS